MEVMGALLAALGAVDAERFITKPAIDIQKPNLILF